MDLTVLQRLNPEAIADPGTRRVVQALLNLIEALVAENQALRAKVQAQRDEINRLKGEYGQPDVRPNRRPPGGSDVSSERERRQPRAWQKGRKPWA
ncbi:MAG: hypothetical protein IT307_08820 [Chloroflexi bacterium]|nr:hypothetical protein [Chloroflexota bacterium]